MDPETIFINANPAEGEIWTSWEPTCELRIFGVGERLQQRWRRAQVVTLSSGNAIGPWEYEWRGVPHVYGGD